MESILKYALSALFGLSVLGKLSGKTKPTFEKAGYSPLFMYGVAFAEVVLTLALFSPYDGYASLGLVAILGGAVFTLYRQNAAANQYLSALLGLILLAVLFFQTAP